jgi:acyl-[acyl-carrier-protein]-phospholipid O-acyltransferase/long-chain-fatty-acid--[acyl-carrier-protein] ligase
MTADDLLDLWPWTLPAFVLLYVLAAWFVPGLMRPVFWVVAQALYRFHVYHADRIPATGPVLVVANHVTYLDWLILWIASPRPLTFVLWEGFYRKPVFRFFLSFARDRTIAIDNARGRPHAAVAALDKVAAALEAGRAVVVYPEGTLTRNGQMLPFGRGIERVLNQTRQPVVVIPTYLDNLWGTQFSWDGGRILWKWPAGPFRRRIAVFFGKPLPQSSTAAEVRAAVQEANADCGIRQSDFLLSPPRAFVRQAVKFRYLFRPALVDVATGTERRLSFGKTVVAAWSLGAWLERRLGPEPNVGVWLPTGLGSTLTNMALAFLGKTVVNLNYTAGEDALRSALRQADIRTILTAKRFLDRMPLTIPEGIQQIHLEDALAAISGREKFLKFLAVLLLPGWILDRFILNLTRVRPDDVITILFSSGSTGEPKGVMLSHRNIAANVDGFIRGVNFTRYDRMLATLPFFHTFGYEVCQWAPLLVGMEAVFFPDPRAAKEIGELCRKYQCTILLGTATFVRFYLRRCEPGDFRSLRLLICGAEKLPVTLAEQFRAKFDHLPLEGYGCTELSPVVSTNLHDVEVGGLRQKANTMGTVGQPIPGVVARAFDPESLAPLPPATEGLLGVKGANVMLGYLHHPEKTRDVIRDGWYISGDVGLIEKDGFIRITGRVSRFAKIAGEMVPLERLDEEMHEILATGGERVLAVAAVPDEKRGERVVVLHLPEAGERLAWVFEQLRKQGIPNLWIPDPRDCYPVEAFPVLGSGKLDLRRLGEVAKEVAGRR